MSVYYIISNIQFILMTFYIYYKSLFWWELQSLSYPTVLSACDSNHLCYFVIAAV